jgi:predicted ATPase
MQESTKSSDDTFSFIGKHSAVVERLRAICEDVDAPPEFAEIVSQHLQLVTDMNTPAQDDNSRSNEKATASSSLVSFMAKVFLRCTEESSLVLIALDNVHQTDEMSWKVIQELFETGTKLLIFCTSRPLSTYSLAVDKVFWSDLNDSYERKGRFVKFDLEPLSKEEVLSMIAMSVNVHEDEVSEDVLNDVFTQSGGMPQYVNELMETAKRHHSVDVIQTENGSRTRRNSHLLKVRHKDHSSPAYLSLNVLTCP